MRDIHSLNELLVRFDHDYQKLRQEHGITVIVGMLDAHIPTAVPISPSGISGFIFTSSDPSVNNIISQIFNDTTTENPYKGIPYRIVTPANDRLGNGAEWGRNFA